MTYELKPARVKIISGLDINKGGIYTYTSPHESYYFKKKILMFSIP